MTFYCEFCGKPTPKEETFLFESTSSSWKLSCRSCLNALAGCAGCIKSSICEFETNPDPTPKVIEQTVRTPMGIMTATVKNPDRESLFCQNCLCFSPQEKTCLKQTAGFCSNHERAV